MERSHDEEIILITVVPQETEVEERKYRTFAAKCSITRSEFYAAYKTGLDAKWIFSLNREDYEETRAVIEDNVEVYATRVAYMGAIYEVIRTYCPEAGDLEIVVK